MYGSPVGNITITQSTQIVPVGYHARLFGINFLTSGTGSTVNFYDNGPTGTLVVSEKGTDPPFTENYGINGIEFTNGIYVAFDAKTLRATVVYRQEEKN